MSEKEKLSDILGPIIKEEPIEKLTAEEYVVRRLQQAENTLNRTSALLVQQRENAAFLSRKNDLLVKIIAFIFENFDFEFVNSELFVSYDHATVTDESIKNAIDGFIKEFKEKEEDD